MDNCKKNKNIEKVRIDTIEQLFTFFDDVGIPNPFSDQHANMKQKALESLRESENPEDCLIFLGSEDRMEFFLEFIDDFKKRGVYEIGLFMVINGMNMNFISCVYPAKVLLDLLKDADQEKLQRCGDRLPFADSIEVYRGVINDNDKSSINRCSWTLNKNVAAWFAVESSRNDRGKNDKPAVYKRIASPEAIFYYNNERKEQEVVLDPNKCGPAIKLSNMPKPIN
ncbi:hypothetical protein [Desulforhopalus sp. IMCC35007]|uniref:hypothetical protein n=1 Tax=Desulforhopalus sp. IMCC35007 TaxID=2569543 RepID=UPI0010AEB773|nr:hypothetical protein [Desulforhopalus sp. IMCC35007]TKB07677.1 hypothetical protein FCL48_16770 [Desulforhopalus sp. IMCC35007]